MTAEPVQAGAAPCILQLGQQLQGEQGSPRELLCCSVCLPCWRQGGQQLEGGRLVLKKVLHSPAGTPQPTFARHTVSVSRQVSTCECDADF